MDDTNTGGSRQCAEASEHTLFLRRSLANSLVLVGLLSSACASIGPDQLISSHTSYNDAIQLTVTREVLANIVRSRYTDPMQFIAVSSINAQFSVSTSASAGAAGIGQAGTAGDLGASVGYSDSPTITYVPLSDAAFHKSYYGLFGVSETLGIWLAYRFAEADSSWQALSLSFAFASINGASDFVGGKSNQLFVQRIDAIVRLIQLGAFLEQVPEWDFDTISLPKAKVTAEDQVEAFKQGLSFIEEDDGENVRLARYRLVVAVTLPDPDRPEVIEALHDLGVEPGNSRYVIRPPMHSSPGFVDPHAIWVTPRSMSDMINLATYFVDIPTSHAEIVVSPATIGQSPLELPPVRIRSSQTEPPFPYRVLHRGYWFYVDDSDLRSRMFLEAMVASYSSRIGSKQADDAAPQMVLPVGGG